MPPERLELGDLVCFEDKSGNLCHGVVTELIELTDKCRIYWFHLKAEQLHRRYINSELSRIRVIGEEDEA